MKAGKSSNMIFTVLIMLALLCLSVTIGQAAEVRQLSPTQQPVQKVKQRTLKATTSSQVIAPVVQRVTPGHPSLTAGGNPVTVTLEGSNLDLITSVQILFNSKIVSNVAAQLGVSAATPQGTSPARDMESRADLAKLSSDVTDRLGKNLPDSRPSGTVMIDTVPLPEKPASGLPGSRLPDRQVTLTAQSGAPAGNYQVRIIAGSQTINLSTDVLTVVVKAPSPSAGSSGSGDGVTGVSLPPVGDPKQASDTFGQQDGFALQNPDAGSNNITGIRGTAAEPKVSIQTGMATGRTISPALQSGSGPSLVTPSAAPSRPPASSLATRVQGVAGADITPREFTPSSKVAVKPEDVMAQRQAGTISASQFNRIVTGVFRNARFDANACGGSYKDRKIITSIPNTFFEEAVGAIGRLDYELTGGEQDRSRWELNGHPRWREHIRACVDDWNGRTWAGAVERGRFMVRIVFESSPQFITTRALHGGYRTNWDWNDESARIVIPDYWFNGLALEVLLTPRLDGDMISFSDVDARWAFVGGDLFSIKGKFRLEENRQRIINYKDEAMERIRGKIISVFRIPAVRDRVAEAITSSVTGNRFVNRITALTGGDDSITYDYE